MSPVAAGIAIALRTLRPDVRLVGVQAEAICPLAGGTEHRYTIAEGIAVKQPGTLTSAILAELLDYPMATFAATIEEKDGKRWFTDPGDNFTNGRPPTPLTPPQFEPSARGDRRRRSRRASPRRSCR